METADLIIRGSQIFDSTGEAPFAGWIAVKDRRIAAVFPGALDTSRIGPGTILVDAGDRTITCGFHDSHTHLLMAGMFRSYPNLSAARSESEAVAFMRADADAHPEKGGWVIGFGWYHVFWENKQLPTKDTLDAVFPNRPVLLLNAEAHGAWVNSVALRIAGIDRDTPDPFGGEVARDASGEATGFLYESAVGLVTKHAMALPEDEEKRLIRAYMEGAKRYGITSVNDVMPYFHGNMGSPAVYSAMDQADELTVRIHAAPDLLGDLDEVLRWRALYNSDKLRFDMVKSFLDGVSTTHTALMLEDYADAPGNRGRSLFDLELIGQAVPEAHRRGLSVKLHSCGDASLRKALDFYEYAREIYGENHCRHAIEHCEIVDAADIPRFGALDVVPSVQPEHLALTRTFAENPYRVTLGEDLAAQTWPLRRMLKSAGVLAIGSDCPVVDSNPFLEIGRAVTRTHNDGEPKGGWNPAEKLSLAEVLRAYTWGSAYAVGREDELGTLEVGKFADIAITDANLFSVEAEALKECTVWMTVMDGKIVYTK